MSEIYLLDDHELMREGLRALLHAHGHHVVGEAPTCAQATLDLQALAPALLLLDLHLAGESGLQVLADMQHQHRRTRTLVLTMSAQPHDVTQALRLGAAGYVLKGIGAKELMTAIDTVLEGGQYFSASIAHVAASAQGVGAADATPPALSAREREIVARVVRGQSSTAIGVALNLSPKTVDSYRSRLMTKLNVADVPALVLWAIRSGVVDADEP
jgi:two-component system, NarL family, invasion response regulator UvrY